MSRTSHLIFTEKRTDLRQSQTIDDGGLLFQSPHGVPLVWFFAFGGRNIWNPGDDVEARGGKVGRRNPYETLVEVAVARLEQAEHELKSDGYLWPFLSAMPILRRKLELKPGTGFIRVAAPWIIGMEEQHIDIWRSATAFAENCVNMTAADRRIDALRSLEQLRPFAPFIPTATAADRGTLKKHPAYPNEDDALRLALLTLGEPDNRNVFVKAAKRDCASALESYDELVQKSPPPAVSPIKEVPTSSGFIGKLAGFFKRS